MNSNTLIKISITLIFRTRGDLQSERNNDCAATRRCYRLCVTFHAGILQVLFGLSDRLKLPALKTSKTFLWCNFCSLY